MTQYNKYFVVIKKIRYSFDKSIKESYSYIVFIMKLNASTNPREERENQLLIKSIRLRSQRSPFVDRLNISITCAERNLK